MFTYKHYVSVLKAKEGEFNALQETLAATKDTMTPLMEVTPIPWNFENETYSKTIDEHLSKLTDKLNLSWGPERRIFIDSNSLEGNLRMLDGTTHHLLWLFNDFRRVNLLSVPVTGLDKHGDYKAAVRSIKNTDNRGICLRLETEDLINPQLAQRIAAELNYYVLTEQDVDLIIDLKSIAENSLDYALFTVSNVINFVLPNLNNWRSLSVCGSSFPINLTDITANTTDTIDRIEWHFWNRLILMAGLKRKPSFGDYTIAHWNTVELDPRIMTMSASIRYTCDDYWLIIRGISVKKESGQHHNLCSILIARPEYCGAAYSWGDNYINECAARRVGPGNPTTWRKVANNHHFQKVAVQLAIVP